MKKIGNIPPQGNGAAKPLSAVRDWKYFSTAENWTQTTHNKTEKVTRTRTEKVHFLIEKVETFI